MNFQGSGPDRAKQGKGGLLDPVPTYTGHKGTHSARITGLTSVEDWICAHSHEEGKATESKPLAVFYRVDYANINILNITDGALLQSHFSIIIIIIICICIFLF